jgi:hypothetical protein
MRTDDYVSLILSVLNRFAMAIQDYDVDFEIVEEREVIVEGRVTFKDGSYLDLAEEVLITGRGELVRLDYRYQFIAEGRPVFRYDSAPHHPKVSTFPHHKHGADQKEPEPAQPPTLNQVLLEILYEQT